MTHPASFRVIEIGIFILCWTTAVQIGKVKEKCLPSQFSTLTKALGKGEVCLEFGAPVVV